MKRQTLLICIFLPVTVWRPGIVSKTSAETETWYNTGFRSVYTTGGHTTGDHEVGIRAVGVHKVGESYGGGIVFYVSDNGQHGLIAAREDQHAGVPWYNGLTRFAGTESDGLGVGATNTKTIVSKLIHDDEKGIFAARACTDYSVKEEGKVYKDWYLPSKFELNLLYQQKAAVGGFVNAVYWSSTEYKTNSIWIQEFGNGHQRVSNSESYANAVRAIRGF